MKKSLVTFAAAFAGGVVFGCEDGLGFADLGNRGKSGTHLGKIGLRRCGGNQVLDSAIGALEDLLNKTRFAQGVESSVEGGLAAQCGQAHGLAHCHRPPLRMLQRNRIEQCDGIFVERGNAFLLNGICDLQKPEVQITHLNTHFLRDIIGQIPVSIRKGRIACHIR